MKRPGIELAILLLVTPCPPAILAAQSPGGTQVRATVRGVVYDSIAAAPLRGASIQMVGASNEVLGQRFTADADSAGHFSIRNVPPGRYLAGFQHPRLDSLGLEIEDQSLTVAGPDVRLDLATPSSRTYIALTCPADASGSLLVGHVRQVGSQAPLADASVVAIWSELDTTTVFIAQRNRERAIRTSPGGWFALCGLPSEVTVLTRASVGPDSSGYVRRTLPRGAVQVAAFSVGGAVRQRVAAGIEGASPQSVWRGEARLSGIVRDERGQPLANARLTVWGAGTEITTDARGRFTLGELPGGTQTVEVRAIGFQPVEQTVVLSAADPATLDIQLRERVTELAGVNVRATAVRARLTPFYDRMRDSERGINHGYFITPEEMERRRPTLITNMFEGLAGVHVERCPGSMDPKCTVVRGALREAFGFCPMTIYLDGSRVAGVAGGGHDPINYLINPTTVAAMEVYPRPASAPPQYQSLNGTCGVILIWTK